MTDRVFNLLREAWLPVRRLSGAGELLRPRDLTDGIHEDPIVAFDWGRPDFDTASREFLIGLLSTACAARVLDGRAWRDWWRNPPSADALDASLASFADAFDLDGDGPRFMQDREDFAGAAVPVEALLIDSPGENTIKFNKDLFVRRGRVGTLSRGAAAMALFALHTYAPEGGRGLCTGLRGGGPMTCTVLL